MKAIWILVCVAALAACGGGGGGTAPENLPDAGGGQVVQSMFQSQAAKFSYPIRVYLPPSYEADGALLPAIYVTEADAPFGGAIAGGPVAGTVQRFETFKRAMQRRGTRAILVGIDGTARRDTDFLLPTARDYLNFIARELAPQIERQYRADPKRRALSGLSHGGYFVVAALVMEGVEGTPSFSHYLSTDASYGGHANPAAFLEYEKQLDAAGRPVPATLLLAGAAPDGTTNGRLVKSLYDQMAAHAHAGLVIHHASFNTTHVGADVPAFEEALARYFP